jgi:myo-inositol-1(or 4)-monophosphatase
MMQRLPPQQELVAFEDAAAEIATRAAGLLREKLRTGVAIEFKDKRQRDPVTAVDRAVEALVRDELRQRFPSHGILGEEGTGDAIASEYVWVLDPLDGTANFAAGLPFFGLSLALLHDGMPIVGCLYLPYWPGDGPAILRASRGNGARIGDETVRLEQQPFRPGGPIAVPPGLRMMFRQQGDLAKRPGEARNLGSIVAELAMVATGGFQYAVFGGPRLWDVAAGVLIVQEAGGFAYTWDGDRWRTLHRFLAPIAKPDPKKPDAKPKTLRDWVRPVLVATPGAAHHVASGLAPHKPPPRAVVWAIKKRGAAMKWLKRRGKPEPSKSNDAPKASDEANGAATAAAPAPDAANTPAPPPPPGA